MFLKINLWIITLFFIMLFFGIKNSAEAACSLIMEDTQCAYGCVGGCSSGGGYFILVSCIGLCPDGRLLSQFRIYECDPQDDGCSILEPGCFTPQTQISTPSGEKPIKDLKAGDTVKSFDPTTGRETTSLVEKIYEVTRSAYYKIKLKDGTELQVTGEHPLYAKASSFAKASEDKSEDKSEDQPLSFWDYLLTESLTRKIIDRLWLNLSF